MRHLIFRAALAAALLIPVPETARGESPAADEAPDTLASTEADANAALVWRIRWDDAITPVTGAGIDATRLRMFLILEPVVGSSLRQRGAPPPATLSWPREPDFSSSSRVESVKTKPRSPSASTVSPQRRPGIWRTSFWVQAKRPT